MHHIGADMSKDTFHAAFDDQKARVFANTKTGIGDFQKALRDTGSPQEDIRIGVESTGIYHLLFCHALTKAGFSVFLINPLITHLIIAAGSLQSVKTDRKDAIAIREAVMTGKGYLFLETEESGILKSLFREYSSLTLMKSTCKQQLHIRKKQEEIFPGSPESRFPRLAAFLEQECGQLRESMEAYSSQTQSLLRSIPGIGGISAAARIAYVGDINRFSSARKLVAYCGMACRIHESGTSIKGKGYLTKRGHAQLRKVLFNAAFIASRHNPECKAFFEKKIQE
jgi:transposase